MSARRQWRRRRQARPKLTGTHEKATRGGHNERQRLTETRDARRRTKEEDRGEEEDELMRTDCSVVGTSCRRRNRRGSGVQANGDNDAELLDINGEVKDGRSSDAEANSG